MSERATERDEPLLQDCPECGGTGEGFITGTDCPQCMGTGEISYRIAEQIDAPTESLNRMEFPAMEQAVERIRDVFHRDVEPRHWLTVRKVDVEQLLVAATWFLADRAPTDEAPERERLMEEGLDAATDYIEFLERKFADLTEAAFGERRFDEIPNVWGRLLGRVRPEPASEGEGEPDGDE